MKPKQSHRTPIRSAGGARIVLVALAAAIAAFLLAGLNDDLTFETLAAERARLHAWVENNPVLAPLTLTLAYALVVLFSLPIAALATLSIGFLLGTALASVVVVVGATVGATGLFLIASTALGERWRDRAAKWLIRFDAGFRDNAFQYLLVLRLVPVIPFFVINVLPAFAGVTLRQYVAATFIGIVPGTVVYCSVGAGLDAVFARGETPDLSVLSDPAVSLPLFGLAVLAALPIVYRKVRGKPPPAKTVEPTACPPGT